MEYKTAETKHSENNESILVDSMKKINEKSIEKNAIKPNANQILVGLYQEAQEHYDNSQNKTHRFWDTQPTPKVNKKLPVEVVGPIQERKNVREIRQEPYPLPCMFEWVTCDVSNDDEMKSIYALLNLNYVEDDDNMFRFDYSTEFLRWALQPPGYIKDWHVGVKTTKGKLVAFITGVPATMNVHDNIIKVAEINFLCVHKKLRNKRLAPVLIKEITRRVNLKNIWQAVYTAGILLTKPIAQCTYFHRSINIKKLTEVRFTSLGKRMTMSMAHKLYQLPPSTQITGLRPMEPQDIEIVLKLLNSDFRQNSKLYPVFSIEDAKHMLLPKKNVIVSYVRETQDIITDFFTFYILPSSVIHHEKHKSVVAAYAYYSVAQSVAIVDLMRDALVVARDIGIDVYNALDLNNNHKFFYDLKFGKGDGSLKYYLFNYLCPAVEAKQIGLVML